MLCWLRSVPITIFFSFFGVLPRGSVASISGMQVFAATPARTRSSTIAFLAAKRVPTSLSPFITPSSSSCIGSKPAARSSRVTAAAGSGCVSLTFCRRSSIVAMLLLSCTGSCTYASCQLG